MSVATIATIEKLLEVANTAIQIGMELQKKSLELQLKHAKGETITDSELDQHEKNARILLEKLKALNGS